MLTLAERHRHAVRAALLDGETGEQAFTSWQKLVSLENVDHDEFRILPLIYLRARERGCSVPEMGRLKGVYRQVWVRNTLLLQSCAHVVRLLAAAAIPTILLKGIAMFACWTAEVGPRSMRDVDILVPRSDARRAGRLLDKAGWRRTILPIVEQSTEADLDWWPGVSLTNADGAELDLHWRALPRNTAPEHAAMFWAGSRPHAVMGEMTRVLRPEDQLYHSLLHGARWTDGAGLDWIVDVASVLRVCPQPLDWRRVLVHAERDRSMPAIEHQMRCLRDVLGIETPISGVSGDRRGSPLDRYVFRRYREPRFNPQRGDITLVNLHADMLGRGPQSRLRAVLGFVCRQWTLEHPAELLPETIFRCFGRPRAARRWLARSCLARTVQAKSLPAIDNFCSLSEAERSPFLSGWSGAEAAGRWTSGVDNVLAFSDESDQRDDLLISLRATPYLTPRHRRLNVEVFANGHFCAAWRFVGEAMTSKALAFTVPAAVRRLRRDNLHFIFCVQNPGRPSRTGETRDGRRLGLFLESLSFGVEDVTDPFAGPLDFLDGRNDRILLSGWSYPEPEGRWTDGPRASLALRWSAPDEEIEVKLIGRMFEGAGEGLAVSANGTPAAHITVGSDRRVAVPLRARPIRNGEGSMLRLDLSVVQPRSPLSCGFSKDTRLLGFHLEQLELNRF